MKLYEEKTPTMKHFGAHLKEQLLLFLVLCVKKNVSDYNEKVGLGDGETWKSPFGVRTAWNGGYWAKNDPSTLCKVRRWTVWMSRVCFFTGRLLNSSGGHSGQGLMDNAPQE